MKFYLSRDFFLWRYLSGALFLVTLLFGVHVSEASAATYYVDNADGGASDSNPGSVGSPWLTIQKAANTLVGGDTVIVKAGTYNEVPVTTVSGSSGSRIIFQAQGTVTTRGFRINHEYITVDGFTITGTPYQSNQGYLDLNGADYCDVKNNTVNSTANAYGVQFNSATDYCTITDNTFDNFILPIIDLRGSFNTIEGNTLQNSHHDAMRVFGHDQTIRGNYFNHIDDNGITHTDLFQTFGVNNETSYNILIEKNLAVDCRAQIGHTQTASTMVSNIGNIRDWDMRNNMFIRVYSALQIGIPKFRVYNNLFYDSGRNASGAILVRQGYFSQYGGNDAIIKNNVFIGNGSTPSRTDFGWYHIIGAIYNFDADYNYVAGVAPGFGAKSSAKFTEAHGINGGDPGFTNVSADNFTPLSSSALLDVATSISGFSEDYIAVSRPQGAAWDMGPYEYNAGGGDTAPPTVTSVSSSVSDGTYGEGSVIDIDVSFSEAVTSTGLVTVTLETGTTDQTCTFSVSSSQTGTCDYTVVDGDASPDLRVQSISGVIKDAANNTMTNFAPAANLSHNKDIVIDTTSADPGTVAPETPDFSLRVPRLYIKEKGKSRSELRHQKEVSEEGFTLSGSGTDIAYGRVEIYHKNELKKTVDVGANGVWKTFMKAKDGTKRYLLKFFDEGDALLDTKSRVIEVDGKKPRFTSLPPANKVVVAGQTPIWWRVKDDKDIDKYRIAIGSKRHYTTKKEFVIPADTPKGVQRVELKAYDNVGNTKTEVFKIVVK